MLFCLVETLLSTNEMTEAEYKKKKKKKTIRQTAIHGAGVCFKQEYSPGWPLGCLSLPCEHKARKHYKPEPVAR